VRYNSEPHAQQRGDADNSRAWDEHTITAIENAPLSRSNDVQEPQNHILSPVSRPTSQEGVNFERSYGFDLPPAAFQTRLSPLHSTPPTQDHGPQLQAREELTTIIQAPVEQELRYQLVIRDQPKRARACGHAADRRPIDPAPILELKMFDIRGQQQTLQAFCGTMHFVHVTLFSADGRHERMNTAHSPKVYNLVGQYVVTGQIAKDNEDREGCFFSFTGLACRYPGRYRLRFVLMRIDPTIPPGDGRPQLAEVFSEPFHVLPAKEYEGKGQRSDLASALGLPGNKSRQRRRLQRRPGATPDGGQ
jgi:hypothetical protein